MNILDGKKTHITVLLGIIAAIAVWMQGGVDTGTLVLEILGLLGMSTLRLGIDTNPVFIFLAGAKTHILVALAVATVAGNFALGNVDAATAVQQLLVAFGVSGLRVGLAKT